MHRESVKTDFLGIKNQNWKAASRNLRPPAFLLYLYLASNADNYTLALSPAAVRQEIGMARSTYHDQFHILVDKGYLVPAHGNTYDFYETPQPRPENQVGSHLSEDGYDFENSTSPDNAVVRNTHHIEQTGIVKICAVRNSPKSEFRRQCAGFTEWSVAERRKSSAARRSGGVRSDPLAVFHRGQAAGVY